MKKMHLFAWMALLAWLLVGCSQPQSGGTSSPPPQTKPATSEPIHTSTVPAPSSQECQYSESDLSAWVTSLPYEEVSLFPQIYQEQSTLNLWFVNPDLTQASVEEISTRAMDSALSALKQLSLQHNCVLQFDSFFVTVVDPQYQTWFSGSLRSTDVAQITAIEGNDNSSEVGGGRIAPTDENTLSGGGQACRWAGIVNKFAEQAPTSGQYAAFTLIQKDGIVELSVFLVLPQPPTDGQVAQLIAAIYESAGCWRTQIQGISLILTLSNYQVVLTGYQPLNPGGGYDPAAFSFTRLEAP